MNLEQELKYLLNQPIPDYVKESSVKLNVVHGYFGDKNYRIRLHLKSPVKNLKEITPANIQKSYFGRKELTSDYTLREKEEELISAEESIEKLSQCGDQIIIKDRYLFIFKHNEWEIDHFKGHLEGLEIAEIEFHKIKSKPYKNLEKPEFIGKEITAMSQYSNLNLSKIKSLREITEKP